MYTSITRDGLTFQFLAEPDGTTWAEARRSDGELVCFEEVDADEDSSTFAARWITERLGAIRPVRRCSSCGLPVDVVPPWTVARHRHPNHAVRFDLWSRWTDAGDGEDDDGEFLVGTIICMTCRDDLVARCEWMSPLFRLPDRRRRAR
jgi:hypothetical protein